MEETQIIKTKTKKDLNIKLTKFTLLLVIIFTVEFFLRDPLRQISTSFQLLFNYEKYDLCKTFDFVAYVENEAFYLLVILLLNFTNTYAALLIVFLKSLVYYINGILKLVYLDSRPFWAEENLKPCKCTANYGNPSTSAFCQFLIYLSVYKAFSTASTIKINKSLLKILCLFPPIMIVGSRILQNSHSFNQILFGMALAYVTFYFFFDVLECDFNNENQFKWIFKNIFVISVTTVFMIILSFMFHVSLDLSVNDTWLKTITKYCEYKEFNFFDNESYVKTCRMFLFLGSLFGCYIEYTFSFRNRIELFVVYNVDCDNKFNNTKVTLTIWRIGIMSVMFVFLKIIVVGNILGIIKNETFWFYLMLKIVLPLFVDGICIFYILKFMVEFLQLSNDKIYQLKKEKNELPTSKSFNSLILLSLENNLQENLL